MSLSTIIRLDTVLRHTGLSRSTLYRKIAEGTFPKQVGISINGAGWYEADVARWIADPAGYRADNDNDAPSAKATDHDAG
ncbi:MAG: AlpA family phage regulatory protein [Gemmobacter sp.]|jgi:prophage regulatory protein|nr:AlpA family phage regulatory protein [Gemmobacter sp.]